MDLIGGFPPWLAICCWGVSSSVSKIYIGTHLSFSYVIWIFPKTLFNCFCASPVYFFDTVNENYFFGVSDFYGFIRDVEGTHAYGICPPLSTNQPSREGGFFFKLRALKENRPEPDYFCTWEILELVINNVNLCFLVSYNSTDQIRKIKNRNKAVYIYLLKYPDVAPTISRLSHPINKPSMVTVARNKATTLKRSSCFPLNVKRRHKYPPNIIPRTEPKNKTRNKTTTLKTSYFSVENQDLWHVRNEQDINKIIHGPV